ncbi:putative uncharacterized protein C7orf78 homolog [Brachyistius frenatus]|uniref:putative uncharacterized protein C7orf78 homolog n=1 Tax=Brachyistius frenatus TaxID=100188 RepID=UPI0037E9A666
MRDRRKTRSKTPPRGSSRPPPAFSFESKTRFSASRELSLARSGRFGPGEAESRSDPRRVGPPDFSLKLHCCQKEGRKADSKAAAGRRPVEAKRKTPLFLPDVARVSPSGKGPPKFVTSYAPPDALRSELMFVETGKFPSGPYRNPKPHDFRPLDEDLPDVITTYERDPGNLKLKLKHVDTLQTTRSETDFTTRDATTQMDTFKPAEPKWDGDLVLPPLPWPPKSASYTRHQRRRGAYSVFLDRVEEKLCRSWKK